MRMGCPYIDWLPQHTKTGSARDESPGMGRIIRISGFRYMVLDDEDINQLITTCGGGEPVYNGCEKRLFRRGGELVTIRRLVPRGVYEAPVLRLLKGTGHVPRLIEKHVVDGYEVSLVTEFIDGERLDTILKRLIGEDRWGEASQLFMEVLRTTIEIDKTLAIHEGAKEPKDILARQWLSRLLIRADQLGILGLEEASKTLRKIHRALETSGGLSPSRYLGRIHGDTHLGQYILSGGRIYVTDFMGEPYREPIPRTMPEEPLRDVATLLNSLDYILWMTGRRGAEEAQEIYRYVASEAYRSLYLDSTWGRFMRSLLFWRIERAAYELLYEELMRTGLASIPMDTLLRSSEELINILG